MSNKKAAQEFLQMVAEGKVKEAYQLFVSESLIHHNAFFKGDRASLMKAMEENAKQTPQKELVIKRVMEDSNFVMTYSHIKQNPSDIGAAVVHIFRFENGKVAELWDAGQAIPEDMVNENGVF